MTGDAQRRDRRPAGTTRSRQWWCIQPTAFCNINCTYCYLPDRSNKHVMAQSTVTRLFSELFASGWAASELTVIWHAGEPLVGADLVLS